MSDVLAHLARPPYYVCAKNFSPSGDPSAVRALLGEQSDADDVCFTKVRINPAASERAGAGTQLSRTHRAMGLHTDSSYERRPHELIAFQMVHADADGGDTILAPVGEVVDRLDAAKLDTLRQPIFPFGKTAHAILEGHASDTRIRYYRRQIAPGLDPLKPNSLKCIQALDELDATLAKVGERHRIKLAPGDVLFLNNCKALHGRTAMPSTSDRLVFRFRKHIET
ncbi:MAG: TauD/TfdA family dioxygenase [Pseudomonadota bacterium]